MGRLKEIMNSTDAHMNRSGAKVLFEINRRGTPGKKVVRAEARRQAKEAFQQSFRAEQGNKAQALASNKEKVYEQYGRAGSHVLERLTAITKRSG